MLSAVSGLLTILVATLAGNWIGAQIRATITGQPAFGLRSHVVTDEGISFKNFPVATKFYPALLAAVVGKPRWLFAFVGGIVTGAAIDDRVEQFWFGWISRRLFGRRPFVPLPDEPSPTSLDA